MKKFLGILLGLLVLVGAVGFFALPRLVSVDNVKQLAAEQVQKFTGRQLDIKGAVSIAFWPTVSVVLEDVHLSNAEWSQHKEMVAVKKLALELAWMPLIAGEIQVNRFVLSEPDIWLEISKNNKANWDFAYNGKLRGEVELADAKNTAADSGGGMTSLSSLKLGEIKIEGGKLNYSDHKTGAHHEVSAIDLALVMRDINAPIKLAIDAKYKNQPMQMKLQTGALSDLNGKGSTDATLDISSPVAEVSFTGMVNKKEAAISADGKIVASSKDLRALMAMLGSKMSGDSATFRKAGINGKIKLDGNSVEFSPAMVELDSISGSGTIAINYGSGLPAINADLSFESLDVTPYSGKTEKSAAIFGISEAYAESPRGWDNTPMDFGWLKGLNLTTKVKTASFKSGDFVMENLDVRLSIDKGRLQLKLPAAKLYGGEGNIELSLQAIDGGTALQSKGSLTGVNVGAVLKSFDSEFMTGSGDVQWNIATSGVSQQRWMENMQGSLSAIVKDGTMKGMNMLDMAKNLAASFNPTAQQQGAGTKFNLIKASFDGTSGVFASKDILMEATGLNATGEGKVRLASQQIDFTVKPTIVAASNAKSASSMTVKIDGSWYAPRFRPDMKATIEKALQDPESAKKSLQDLRKNLKGLLTQ